MTTKPVIGWREWVTIPSLASTPIKAKIDTGARTSALHAFDLRLAERDGQTVAAFAVHPIQHTSDHEQWAEHPVLEFRDVRSSNGTIETRPVIRVEVVLGDQAFEVDLTLTSRDEMGFRMLLGRSAVRRRFLVDPGRSFLLSK